MIKINYPNEIYIYLKDYSLEEIEKGKLLIKKFANGERERIKVVLDSDNKKAELEIGVGFTSYIISASLREEQTEGTYIKINDVEGFVKAIQNEISRFGYVVTSVHARNCIYNGKVSKCTIGSSYDLEKELGIYSGNIDYRKMMNLVNDCCEDEVLFLENKDDSFKNEYRIVWETDKEATNDLLININKVLDYIEIHKEERLVA